MNAVLQYVLYLVALVALAIPLGTYIKKVMFGEKTFLSKILTPCENAVYRVMSVKKDEQMGWKKYAVSVLIFSGIGLIFLFLLQLLQGNGSVVGDSFEASAAPRRPSWKPAGASRCKMGFIL